MHGEEKRTRHGFGLRAFFDEQLAHLDGLLGGWQGQSVAGDEARETVEQFVNTVNSRLRLVQGYASTLRPPVSALYRHVLDIAEQIPGSFELSHQAFRDNPLVNAMFVGHTDIDQLVKRTPAIDDFLRQHAHLELPRFYALMTVQKQEKRRFGVGMQGEMVLHDLAQQVVNFHDPSLHHPCLTDSDLANELKSFLLDSVVKRLRLQMLELAQQQSLASKDNSYQARINSLANPEVYLRTLQQKLADPAQLLTLQRSHLRLSKLGVKLDANDLSQCANEFDVCELSWNNQTRHLLFQVVYQRMA